MLLSTYTKSASFRRYIPDWITVGLIFAYFFLVAEHARPFDRQFKLSDSTIQHPFAVEERVTGVQCIVIAFVVPTFVIAVMTFFKHRNTKDHAWHVFQVSLLGLSFAVSADGVITDILKVWVGRPRPDFLERCGPVRGTPADKFVDISVCSAPLGAYLLADGMKSTPSGHSSISFSAFLYLSMWIYGQLKLARHPRSIAYYIFAGLPLLLASYIALTRVQDYRHHFVDIFSGGFLGSGIAILVYNKYFHSVTSEKAGEVLGEEEEPVLPL